jgi:hypothetical protein
MARTNPDEVKAILLKDYDGRADLTPFIAEASALVDTVVAVGGRMGKLKLSLSTTQQAQIEMNLAAAMYCFSDPQFISDNAGRSSATRRGENGAFLEASTYGRKACMLDVTRVLKPLVEGRVAGFQWLGKVPSDQIPYCERN